MAASTAKGARAGTASRKPPIEYATLILRCPLCNTEFSCEQPRSQDPEGRDSDLRPSYPVVDPLPTLVQSCPSCQYSAYEEGFGSRREDAEDEDSLPGRPGDRPAVRFEIPDEDDLEDLRRQARRGDLTRGVAEGREPYGAERYVLAARIYEFVRDEEPYGAADFYLRGSWCARVLGAAELERQCQREAVLRFQQAMDRGLVADQDRPRTSYLIAELSRRSGDFGKAVDLFSQLESAADPDEDESAFFAHLARRQLQLATVKSPINAALSDEDLVVERDEDEE